MFGYLLNNLMALKNKEQLDELTWCRIAVRSLCNLYWKPTKKKQNMIIYDSIFPLVILIEKCCQQNHLHRGTNAIVAFQFL